MLWCITKNSLHNESMCKWVNWLKIFFDSNSLELLTILSSLQKSFLMRHNLGHSNKPLLNTKCTSTLEYCNFLWCCAWTLKMIWLHMFFGLFFIQADDRAKSAQQLKTTMLLFHPLYFSSCEGKKFFVWTWNSINLLTLI